MSADAARKVVEEFFAEHLKWEESYEAESEALWDDEEIDDREAAKEQMNAKFGRQLDSIYETYCSKYTNPGLSYGIPRNFNPSEEAVERVESVADDKFEVFTNRTEGFISKNVYIVINRKGRWLIDQRQRIGSNGNREDYPF